MKKLIHFLFLVLMLSTASSVNALVLREQFEAAETGDFLVAAQGKNETLLHIFKKVGHRLVIEEITVPAKARPTISWQDWLSQRAPQHTSWVMYEIDLETGKMIEYYSFTENGWLDMNKGDNFLSTLITLQLQSTPEADRKRVGPRPLSGYIDRRHPWNPPLVLEGVKQTNIAFNAWRTLWPQDGTELAGRHIDLYLPSEKGPYLNYFPYWIEVQGAGSKAKLRIVDSGRHLVSPKTGLPQRKQKA